MEIRMAPPWVQYANALKAIFQYDDDVKVEYDNDGPKVILRVDGQDKADALSQLLPARKEFGNVTLDVAVVPANKEKDTVALFRDAFKGNKAVNDIVTISDIPDMYVSNPLTYIIFRKEVVQYYNDNLADAHGNKTTLFQEIADELFPSRDGIFFCTDNK